MRTVAFLINAAATGIMLYAIFDGKDEEVLIALLFLCYLIPALHFTNPEIMRFCKAFYQRLREKNNAEIREMERRR